MIEGDDRYQSSPSGWRYSWTLAMVLMLALLLLCGALILAAFNRG